MGRGGVGRIQGGHAEGGFALLVREGTCSGPWEKFSCMRGGGVEYVKSLEDFLFVDLMH